jgi:hypothetical protein
MVVLPMQQSFEELLVQTKLISPPQLAVAVRDAELNKKRLAPTLIDLGFVSDRRFAEWMAEQTKLPIGDPISEEAVSELENHVPVELAREYEVLPIDVEADELTVAMINPLDHEAVNVLHSTIGMKIRPVVAVYRNVRDLVTRFYPDPKETFDPSATLAVEKAPFEYGDDTILRMHSRQFAFDQGNESLGSDTRMVAPEQERRADSQSAGPAGEPALRETQLDRIERAIEALQKRMDAIDATLARILSRK